MKSFDSLTKRGQIACLRLLAEEALRDYDIGKAVLTPLEHMANTTFRVDGEGGQRYVIRIQNPSNSEAIPRRMEDQVRSEMEWLAALNRDTDLRVPDPVSTRSNKLLTKAEVEGVPEERACCLFRWVDGRFINKGLTPRHIERVGIFTARLHEHTTKQFRPSKGFTRPTPDNLSAEVAASIIKNFAEVRPPKDVAIVEAVIEKVQEVLDALGTGPDVYGLIHADLHQWNYLFRAGEVRAIDFDDCGFGHFLYDIAVTLFNLLEKKDYPQLRAAFFHGYRSVRPLPEEHEAYIETLFAFRELQMGNWYIEQCNHPAFSDWDGVITYGLGAIKSFAGV